jgi:hypothetical protein
MRQPPRATRIDRLWDYLVDKQSGFIRIFRALSPMENQQILVAQTAALSPLRQNRNPEPASSQTCFQGNPPAHVC